MGHGDARLNGGAALPLAGKDRLPVGGLVGQMAALFLQGDQCVDGGGFVGCRRAQPDALGVQQIGNAHGFGPFLSLLHIKTKAYALAHTSSPIRASISARVASPSEKAVALPQAEPSRRA